MSTFEFDGRPIDVLAGGSVAASLLAAGVQSWRTTRIGGRPRGLFCGIGACHDCLLTIDGAPSLRACLVPATAGMRVSSQDGVGPHAR